MRSRIAVAVLAVYFGIALLPHFVPAVAQQRWWIWYLLSFLVVLPALAVIAIVGTLTRRRALIRVPLAALGAFVVVLAFAWLYARGLPTGSFVKRFDRAAWNAPQAMHFVKGDITPREKMLGDVVRNVLPGRTRAEIEAQLGPSLDTGYFREDGRDLIYLLGPERNLFSIDSEWLLIWLDAQGRFERFEVRND
jgi:hypothetical protein